MARIRQYEGRTKLGSSSTHFRRIYQTNDNDRKQECLLHRRLFSEKKKKKKKGKRCISVKERK
jgi:hypothetical protein